MVPRGGLDLIRLELHCIAVFSYSIHPGSLTVRPWKIVVGRQAFPIGKGAF